MDKKENYMIDEKAGKHDFVYEDRNIGRVVMKEKDANHTTIHTITIDETPVISLEAAWWDLSTIRDEAATNKEYINDMMEKKTISNAISALETIKRDIPKLLPKYNGVRARVLAEDLINELILATKGE